MSNFRVLKLDKNCIAVYDRGSNLIGCCETVLMNNKLVIKHLTGSRNGDGIIFLINEIKKESPNGNLYYSTTSFVAIPPVALMRIEEEKLLTKILD